MDEDLTGILNKEGFFFQKYCVEEIRQSGWSIDAEEYPISADESVDIKASLALYETALHTAVIECKRSDPTRKRWVFYTKEAKGADAKDFLIQVHDLMSSHGGLFRKARVERGVLEILNESSLGNPVCHTIGLEVFKEDERDPRTWKADTQIIYKASLTVAKGINHLFDSEAERIHKTLKIVGLKELQRMKEGLGTPYYLGGTLIPVVVTSAPVFSVSFDPAAMDTTSFKVVPEKTSFIEKDWLVYELPLTRDLQYESKYMFRIVGENRYAKMHVFIVNGKHIRRFFESLTQSLKTSGKNGRSLQVEFFETFKPKNKG